MDKLPPGSHEIGYWATFFILRVNRTGTVLVMMMKKDIRGRTLFSMYQNFNGRSVIVLMG
jgi:hypothetical protein